MENVQQDNKKVISKIPIRGIPEILFNEEKNIFSIQTLGGRDSQEDYSCFYQRKQRKDLFVGLFDGFGGQGVVEYIKNNFQKILDDCDLDPRKFIDSLDLEVRINALYHNDYIERIMEKQKSYQDTEVYKIAQELASNSIFHKGSIEQKKVSQIFKLLGDDNEIKQIDLDKQNNVAHKDQDYPIQDLKEIYKQYYLAQEKGEKEVQTLEKQLLFHPEQRMQIRQKIREFQDKIYQEKQLKFMKMIEKIGKAHQKILEKNNSIEEEKIKTFKKGLIDPHKYASQIQWSQIQSKANANGEKKELFEEFKQIILLEKEDGAKFYSEINDCCTYLTRGNLLKVLSQECRWKRSWLHLEEDFQKKYVLSVQEKDFMKRLPSFGNSSVLVQSAEMYFHRCELDQLDSEQKKIVQLNDLILFGFELLQVYLTLCYIYQGSEQNREQFGFSDCGEQWQQDMQFQGIDYEDEEFEDDLQFYQGQASEILKIFSHDFLAFVSWRVDKVVRFGNNGQVGSTAICVNLDEANKKITIAWRGDSVALIQNNSYDSGKDPAAQSQILIQTEKLYLEELENLKKEEDTLTNQFLLQQQLEQSQALKNPEIDIYSVEHHAIGLSINVGRFIGAVWNEDFYEICKSQLTDVLAVTNINQGDFIILMSDGMYEAYKKYSAANPKDQLFPKQMQPLLIKSYFQKILQNIDYNYKGYDNCTLTVIQVPFSVRNK